MPFEVAPTERTIRAITGLSIRNATPADAACLALAMQEADRGHTGIGSWDVVFTGPDERRLGHLARLARTSQRSYLHWSTFLVAEVDGHPVGTVAGYIPDEMTSDTFVAACQEALGGDAAGALAIGEAWSREYVSVRLPGDTLRVEWVYTDPGYRGRGVSVGLLHRLLEDGRARRLVTAHVGTHLGNAPAIATYRRAGFQEFAECRHADYEDRFKSPGLVFLRKDI